MKFTVDRSKWRRGDSKHSNTYDVTSLLNPQGNMCCLGHICIQLKINAKDLMGKPYPHHISPDVENYSNLVGILVEKSNYDYYASTRLTNKAAEINDNPAINATEREQQLIELFKKYDYEIEFIN